MRRCGGAALRTVAAAFVAVATALLVLPPQAGRAQGTQDHNPSQANPFPRGTSDSQNRGRAHADLYWGVMDGNVPFDRAPLSRVPNPGLNGLLELDGWTFPRGAFNSAPLDPSAGVGLGQPNAAVFGQRVTIYPEAAGFPSVAPPVGSGVPTPLWSYAAGPSTDFTTPNPLIADPDGYFRAPALGRPNVPATDPTLDYSRFTWRFNSGVNQIPVPVAGNDNPQRYRIYVRIPTPPDPQPNPAENRINDARYIVYYYLRSRTNPAVFFEKTKVCFLSQLQGGLAVLVGEDGEPAFFPFYDENFVATNIAPVLTNANRGGATGFRQGVQLDASSANDDNEQFVLADALELVPSTNSVQATPTVSTPGGGRKINAATPGVQPRPGREQTTGVPIAPTDFMNTLEELRALPGGTSPAADFYTSRSVLFFGPESLVDPRRRLTTGAYDATLRGNRIGPGTNNRPQVAVDDPSQPGFQALATRAASSADSNNHELYRLDYGADPTTVAGTVANSTEIGGANAPVPLFSHLQVIVGRTEYLPDPELGVSEDARDGTRTIQVGTVYALDWQTGTALWRFPDITYRPGFQRNPQVGQDPITRAPVYRIPGIFTFDRNSDGDIDEDEVFIGGRSGDGTSSGALFASITVQPNVMVRGTVQVPVRGALPERRILQADTELRNEDERRYSTGAPNYNAVPATVAYVAAANGVLYALDAKGNNDSWYQEDLTDRRLLGRSDPGTTNVLFTFSPSQLGRRPGEQVTDFRRRQKREIPATTSFGASAPVLAFRKEETDPTFNPLTDELRLFVGSQNGILYALDGRGDAGVRVDANNIPIGVEALPFRKGEQFDTDQNGIRSGSVDPNAVVTNRYRDDLKWWFRTRGNGGGSPINASAAVSTKRHIADEGATALNEKGVYFNSTEGRVYSVDWVGPLQISRSSIGNRTLFVASDNPVGTPRETAEKLNDDFYFHNTVPATTTGRADNREGDIRPRWTYPNLYRDLGRNGLGVLVTQRADDHIATTFNGLPGGQIPVADAAALGAIYSAPVLMDFLWRDPRDNSVKLKQYVVVAARDPVANGLPEIEADGRLYLLDQVGDRANFLTNPVISANTGAARRIIARARDRFSPGFPIGDATPAWTFRYVNETYDNDTDNEPNVANRNQPNQGTGGNGSALPAPAGTDTENRNQGVPARKTLPTVYMGGIGRIFATDIDPETGLFMRWRATYQETTNFTPLPTFATSLGGPGNGPNFPVDLQGENRRAMLPLDPVFTAPATARQVALAFRPVLGRTISLNGARSQINAITIGGGALQNRNNTHAPRSPLPGDPGAVAVTLPTVPPRPTLDAPYSNPFITPTPAQLGDPDALEFVDLGVDTVGTAAATIGDTSSVFVNQDINDPLTTSRGAYYSDSGRTPVPPPSTAVPNRSFPYPLLVVSTDDGTLHAISSNTEGEDRTTEAQVFYENESSTVAWALIGVDPLRYNINGHVVHFIQRGPGGTSGAAIVTPAYFPSLDHRFRNVARHTANPTDPFGYYPDGEPNQTGSPSGSAAPVATPSGPVGAGPTAIIPPNNDDPRPDLYPRQLAGTDTSTGQTGFPLDLNGLFFDRRFANQLGTTQAQTSILDENNVADRVILDTQNPNGDYRIRVRLPGYSRIGESATAPVGLNDQIPDGVRIAADATLAQQNINVGDVDFTENDDINPAGQLTAWIFAGGSDGITYAFTPSLPGQGTGFVGGLPVLQPRDGGEFGGLPRVALVDATQFATIQNSLLTGTFPTSVRPTIDQLTIAGQGGNPFYEWGETAYIVVYDVFARTRSQVAQNSRLAFIPDNSTSVTLRITSEVGGVVTRNFPLLRNGGNLVTYSLGPGDYTPPVPPDQFTANVPLGAALISLRLTPGSDLSLTPGDILSIEVEQPQAFDGLGRQRLVAGPPPGAGANSRQQAANSAAAYMAIANPLAVQGFLTEPGNPTQIGRQVTVGTFTGPNGPLANAIGPFAAIADQGAASPVKSRIATNVDPDQPAGNYYAALTNGNYLYRRDLRVFDLTNNFSDGTRRPNPLFRQRLVNDPRFYFPVAAGAGMVNHGTSGSTSNSSAQQENLRIMNRSLLGNLSAVRVDLPDLFRWRSWPGSLPNADADVPQLAPAPLGQPILANNPRFTPQGMDVYGRVNPLPWETQPNEAKPWIPGAPQNLSPDYPNIDARNGAVRIVGPAGDLVAGPTRLPSNLTNNNTVNTSVLQGQRPGRLAEDRYSVAANISAPKYQPANVVAMHSLTSTYVAPNLADDPTVLQNSSTSNVLLGAVGIEGAVQLPRAPAVVGGIVRQLRPIDPNSGSVIANQPAIAPFGYTTRAISYVDSNGNGRFDRGTAAARRNVTRVTGTSPLDPVGNRGESVEAYREFELWMGVNIDMGLKIQETQIDTGAEGHGTGMQNGLLGYSLTSPGVANALRSGFLPAPLYNPTNLPGGRTDGTYGAFSKQFTVLNTGNVNLYNLRASQKTEITQSLATAGSGQPFQYLQMRSTTIDPRFGFLSAGVDPRLPATFDGPTPLTPANFMPQIVTSLDRQFDGFWDTYIRFHPVAGQQAAFTSATDPADASAAPSATSPYTLYYRRFSGRHTLHKPRVGVEAPAVLGIPDVPAQQYLRPVTETQPQGLPSTVAVAIPLGTPSGKYSSQFATTPFAVFEDHDTEAAGYQGVPTVTANGQGITISPAGPLYGRRNNFHPGDPDAVAINGIPGGRQPIRAVNDTTGGAEGIFRPRRYVPPTPAQPQGALEYLPYTSNFILNTTVTETPLTGGVPDRALDNPSFVPVYPQSIVSGLLPGIDAAPLVETNANAGIFRPAAALSPAAYRAPDGSINVFFSRNVNANGTPATQPGQPFRLFRSRLAWDAALGVWVSSNFGGPVNSAQNSQGRWFTVPAAFGPGLAANESNTSPFVLQDQRGLSGANGTATLFWLNAIPTPGGPTVNQIYWAALGADGTPGTPQPWLQNADPSLQRFGPRAAYVPSGNPTTYLFYFGGVPGRWSLYYSTRAAEVGGSPAGSAPNAINNRRLEKVVTIPTTMVSASDPSPIWRSMYVRDPAIQAENAPFIQASVIDLYYTAISRAVQSPEIYMTRYVVSGGGTNGLLTPARLPRVVAEPLASEAREGVWRARHIAWYRTTGNATTTARLPRIYLGQDATGNPVQVTRDDQWQYDTATGLLYQAFRRTAAGPLTVVYVDASAGTVRFRGNGGPQPNEIVRADYEPQTYRITTDRQGSATPFTFMDKMNGFETASLYPNLRNGLINRIGTFAAPDPANANDTNSGIGRHWIFWRKNASGGQGASLYHAARRVGIDLRAIPVGQGGLQATETMLLSGRDNTTLNQYPARAPGDNPPAVLVEADTTGNGGFTAVEAVEVDPAKGRVYIPAKYEGLRVRVAYGAYSTAIGQGGAARVTDGSYVASFIDELSGSSAEQYGVKVPSRETINENQPYAFLDTYNPFLTLNRGNNGALPQALNSQYTGANDPRQPLNPLDPTLTAGRVWLFWSSPRPRLGNQTLVNSGRDPFPSGFDLYWQTLAPNFEASTFTGQAATP